MADYIDRKKLLDEIFEYYKIPLDWDGQITEEAEEIISIVENVPYVDAVEVVRCEDCKYKEIVFDTLVCHNPNLSTYFINKDFFCKYGEK